MTDGLGTGKKLKRYFTLWDILTGDSSHGEVQCHFEDPHQLCDPKQKRLYFSGCWGCHPLRKLTGNSLWATEIFMPEVQCENGKRLALWAADWISISLNVQYIFRLKHGSQVCKLSFWVWSSAYSLSASCTLFSSHSDEAFNVHLKPAEGHKNKTMWNCLTFSFF